MAEKINELTDATFEAEVLKAAGLVVVDFWAPWCAPCVAFAPKFAEYSEKLLDVKFCKLNVDEAPESAKKSTVRAIPTLILFRDGKEAKRVTGTEEARALLRDLFIARHLPKS